MSVSLAFKWLASAAVATATPGLPPPAANPPTAVELVQPVDPQTPDQLPFLIEREYRMVVKVVAPGPTTLDFLVDTAAERSAVSREVAKRLGFSPAKTLPIISFGGTHEVATVHVPELRFSKTVRNNLELMTFASDVMGADGFLGVDALQDKKVEFDFVNERMTVRRANSANAFGASGDVVVRAKRRDGRLIFSDARVNRVSAEALLDTGSSLTIGNTALRDALRARGKLGQTIPVKIMAITGEVIVADYGIVKNVTLPGVTFHDMPMAFSTVQPFKALGMDDRPALLLGMDALHVFGWVMVDFRNRSVEFANRGDGGANIRFMNNTTRGW
jgi:predicted aspartyl protease